MKKVLSLNKQINTMNTRDKQITQRIRSCIKAVDPDAKVVLFGSHARGDARKESDWDVLVLIDHAKTSRAIEAPYRNALLMLELELAEPISTFVYPKQDWENQYRATPLYNSIQEEGIVL